MGLKEFQENDCQECSKSPKCMGADLIFCLLEKLAAEVDHGRGNGIKDNLS